MIKKNILFVIILFFCENISAMDSDSLPEIMKKDEEIRPYIKSVISQSGFLKKQDLLKKIESDELFKKSDFVELRRQVFEKNEWVPHFHEFNNDILKEIFDPFYHKFSEPEPEMIFLANILYVAGGMLYDQKKNYVYLEHSASFGHPDALFKMFSIDFKKEKIAEAKNYLFCSAARGNLEALYTLSRAYEGNLFIGVPKDLNIAFLLCQEASNLGYPEAQFTIEVAAFTEGALGVKKDFQTGVRNAKRLGYEGNQLAKSFIEGIMMSSSEALQEWNEDITKEDINFLRNFLNWKDEGDSEDETA